MAVIKKENFNHGAVIHVIVEYPQYKSINSMTIKGKKIDSAYTVNDRGLFCKYSDKPNSCGEYVFNFGDVMLDSVEFASERYEKVFVALVCVEAHQVCVIEYSKLKELIQQRVGLANREEDSFSLYVKIERSFSVGIKAGNGTRSGLVSCCCLPKNAFPKAIFK